MPVQDQSVIMWVVGGVTLLGVVVLKWMSGRIDHKLGKDVFEEFKKTNKAEHKALMDSNDRQEKTLGEIHLKLEK